MAIGYNHLTTAFLALLGLFSCFAGVMGQGVTAFLKILQIALGVSMSIGAWFAWNNQRPGTVAIIVGVAYLISTLVVAMQKQADDARVADYVQS